jgi:putative transposase
MVASSGAGFIAGEPQLTVRLAAGPSLCTPQARAHAERWVGTVRRECLDRLLILGRRPLQHLLAACVAHYNEHRPHRSLEQRPPCTDPPSDLQSNATVIDRDRVRRRDLLGGLIHEYRLAA